MIEIWTEFGRFKVTNQRLDEQVRTITKNGWFSDLKKVEIHQQIYRQTHRQNPNTVTETINTGKPQTPYKHYMTRINKSQTHKCKHRPKRKK